MTMKTTTTMTMTKWTTKKTSRRTAAASRTLEDRRTRIQTETVLKPWDEPGSADLSQESREVRRCANPALLPPPPASPHTHRFIHLTLTHGGRRPWNHLPPQDELTLNQKHPTGLVMSRTFLPPVFSYTVKVRATLRRFVLLVLFYFFPSSRSCKQASGSQRTQLGGSVQEKDGCVCVRDTERERGIKKEKLHSECFFCNISSIGLLPFLYSQHTM